MTSAANGVMGARQLAAKVLARLLLVGCIGVVLAGCGSNGGGPIAEGTPPEDTGVPSGALELGHPNEWAVARVPGGIAAVAGDHEGHPAVAISNGDGNGSWVAAENVPPLAELVAWRDHNVLRVAGHRCAPDDHATSSARQTTSVPGCRTAPIVALEYSLTESTWSDAIGLIDTDGIATDLGAGTGSGKKVLALLSDGRSGSGMAVIDVDGSSVKKLTGSVPRGPVGCAVGSTRLIAASGPFLRDDDADSSTTSEPSTDGRNPFFGTIAAGMVKASTIKKGELPEDADKAYVSGCTDEGFVMGASWETRDATRGYLVRPVSSDGSELEVVPLPDPRFEGGEVSYIPDLTATTPVVTHTDTTVDPVDQIVQFALWNVEDESWVGGAAQLTAGSNVAVSAAGDQYASVLRGQTEWLERLDESS